MKPINSIEEPGVFEVIKKIKVALDGRSLSTRQQVENADCLYPFYLKKPFDLAKIEWYFSHEDKDFCGTIWGGINYLQHIPTCEGCLTCLRVNLDELLNSEEYKELALNTARNIEYIVINTEKAN